MDLATLKGYEARLSAAIELVKAETDANTPTFPEVRVLLDQSRELEATDRERAIQLTIESAELWVEKAREWKRMNTQ